MVYKPSVAGTILTLVYVLQHIEIGIVTRKRDSPIFYRLEYFATGLIEVHAVAKTALLAHDEYLSEVVRDFFLLEIKSAESSHTGYVDDTAADGQIIHRAESSSVHA